MRDGILVLDKPQNWTSSDCVAICRRVLGVKGIKKVGHGGTLDPMATGVLPIFVGQATRIMEYMDLDSKTYVCNARFGITTDTLDIWGQVLEEQNWQDIRDRQGITEEAIVEALKGFEGDIEQMPPKYSAVRVNGKRLYEYAYKGQEISEDVLAEIKPRKVYIKQITVNEVDMKKGELAFVVECSKGTYVRTICADLGEKLGCGCVMTGLQRVATGNITIEQATVDAEQVKEMDAGQLEKLLLPSDYPLVHFGRVTMPEDRADYFSRGNSIWWSQIKVLEEPDESCRGHKNARGRDYECIYKVYQDNTGEFLGTGFFDKKENKLKADKVFVSQR
ncbi:MAG: tRNA pseudouridine(55) synthase TruB [Clostridia bacterium]|nr:tRNA pseudouridine(55) synthase TruB [Clostridia bacterium]